MVPPAAPKGLVLAGAPMLGLAMCTARRAAFEQLFVDFGGELPTLTKIVLRPWLAPLCALVVTGLLMVALRAPRGRARAMVAAIAVGWTALALHLVGYYLPIYLLAARIR